MSQRAEQVAEELRKIISMILIEDVEDPRMGFVTITGIDVTDDLRYAKVYYSVLGNDAQKTATEEALAEQLKFIRRLAVERINMKFAMEIVFKRDESATRAQRVDEILKKIKESGKG